MRVLFAIFVMVSLLFVLAKLPYPGDPKRPPAPPAKAAATEPTEPAKPKYVTKRECTRGYFGSQSCREVTVVQP